MASSMPKSKFLVSILSDMWHLTVKNTDMMRVLQPAGHMRNRSHTALEYVHAGFLACFQAISLERRKIPTSIFMLS